MKVVLLQSTHKVRQETGRHIYCITDEFNMIVTLFIDAYFLLSNNHSIVPAYLFLSNRSQYRANSSGDLLEELAILVTELLLMNLPHA